LIAGTKISVISQPDMFFLPLDKYRVSSKITLIDGDMFFSTMQTLTISVNVVGVMGKGLASRAKYQFPDVYVEYQEACTKKKLQMGKPYLYKRESSMDRELADDPELLETPNSNKWFLLFATKDHWRNDSDIEGIEKGLAWLVKNYKVSGIKSLAMPALGCGLGNLEWKDVGPLMCKYLSQMDIPTAVYLPREHPIAPEFLQSSFLLSQVDSSSTLF
jgi:O-acetyl-ADP-ribose deacetylase (regulator of RNase III)